MLEQLNANTWLVDEDRRADPIPSKGETFFLNYIFFLIKQQFCYSDFVVVSVDWEAKLRIFIYDAIKRKRVWNTRKQVWRWKS